MNAEPPSPEEIEGDRRSAKRRNPEIEPTHIWISVEKSIKARVLDESDGGLGVHIEDKSNAEFFSVGFQVRVEHHGKRRTANIAYLHDDIADGFRLGLEWID